MHVVEPMKTFSRCTRTQGFTLVELMIVVAIVGVLASVALPNYNRYVERSHRANARSALVQMAQWMERVATATGQYPACNADFTECTVGGKELTFPEPLRLVEGGRYSNITIADSSANSYTLTAAATGPQINDACASFSLDHRGNRTVTGANLTNAQRRACWNQ